MKEFGFSLTDQLVRGLKPRARMRRQPFLEECINLVPHEEGLSGLRLPTDPFNGSQDFNLVTYPFPQISRGHYESLLLGETEISEIDESAFPWAVTSLDTYNAFDPLQTKQIVAGGDWHRAEGYGSWFLFNGSCVVFSTGHNDKVYIQDQVTVRTGCSFRGRFLVGGLDPSNIWQGELANILEGWKGDVPEGFDQTITDPLPNYVLWGTIGGGDFPLWLFYPDDTGFNQGPSEEVFIKKLKRNELGWMPMPFQGEVIRMEPLGDSVIVYGRDGVAALGQSDFTFGLRSLTDIGLASRGAVGVGRGVHLFIGDNGDLYRIGSDLQVQRVGYRDYLLPLLGHNPLIHFGPDRETFFITSVQGSYVLGTGGLSEAHFTVSSIDHTQGGSVGLSTEANPIGLQREDGGKVVSNEFDMSIRGRKRVSVVSLRLAGSADVEVSLYYRYDNNDDWEQSDWLPVNKMGVARFNVTGNDFKVAIRTSGFEDIDIDYIQVRYQPEDKRFIRGPYVETGIPSVG